MFYCDETKSKIIVTTMKNGKVKKKHQTKKLKFVFTVTTRSMYLDCINWPKDFSYFMYINLIKEVYPDDFLIMHICHLESGAKSVFTTEQLGSSEKFDQFFRDSFYKINNFTGNIVVEMIKFRDNCKYCINKNK